jgi:hypothetical protein
VNILGNGCYPAISIKRGTTVIKGILTLFLETQKLLLENPKQAIREPKKLVLSRQ